VSIIPLLPPRCCSASYGASSYKLGTPLRLEWKEPAASYPSLTRRNPRLGTKRTASAHAVYIANQSEPVSPGSSPFR
jgi:hypothetical protein